MKCYGCDNFQENYPIKVVDIPSLSFMDDEVYHFEDGFHCTWNGSTETDVEDLPKNGCRVQEVSKLWEFTVHMKYILHGMMMKSIYQNVMAVILIAGHMNIANTTKKTEYFFSISQ